MRWELRVHGTNDLYHSWAGLAATMNNHDVQQDSSACSANNLGKALALPEGEEPYCARLICTKDCPRAGGTSNE